jgi:hypothetical protein
VQKPLESVSEVENTLETISEVENTLDAISKGEDTLDIVSEVEIEVVSSVEGLLVRREIKLEELFEDFVDHKIALSSINNFYDRVCYVKEAAIGLFLL